MHVFIFSQLFSDTRILFDYLYILLPITGKMWLNLGSWYQNWWKRWFQNTEHGSTTAATISAPGIKSSHKNQPDQAKRFVSVHWIHASDAMVVAKQMEMTRLEPQSFRCCFQSRDVLLADLFTTICTAVTSGLFGWKERGTAIIDGWACHPCI